MRLRPALVLLIVALLAGTIAAGVWAQDTAAIRFVHLKAGSPALDIRVNGELAAAALRFGEASARIHVSAGLAELSAYLPAAQAALFSEMVTLYPGPAAIVIGDTGGAHFRVVSENLEPLEAGSGRIVLYNAMNAPAQLRLHTPAETLAMNVILAARGESKAIDVAAGAYEIAIDGADETVGSRHFSQSIAAGSANLLIVLGRPSEAAIFQLTSAADGGQKSARLRFIHAIDGAAPLDIRLDGQLLAPGLSFAEPTPHLAVEAGAREISVSLGAAEIGSMRLELDAGARRTVALTRSSEGLALLDFVDATAGVDEQSALASLINLIPESVISHLELESGAIIALDMAFGQAGDAATIAPGAQAMTLHLNIADERGEVAIPPHHFHGGSLYSLVALPGGVFSAPRMLIVETSVERHIRATLEQDAIQPTELPATAEPTDAPTVAPTEHATMPEPTATAARQTAAPEVDERVASPEPETEASAAPEARERALTPYAIVNLDPEGALHMRQYPSIEAMSLGLLPAQSELMILGRRGPAETEAGESGALPLDLGVFSDPAAGLLPWQDLEAGDTWLYAMYRTPDEGALYGWVNALFLQVFQPSGERQRLASLTQAPQNQPGRAHNTEIQPPQLADRIAAQVWGLQSPATLNLRRRNDASSEALSQIPAEQLLRLIGLDAQESWAYVEYQPAVGNAVRGWVSMRYIQLLLNGEPVSSAGLRAMDPSAVPQISASAAGGIQPVVTERAPQTLVGIIGEVNVNFDSALHLRRYPDATSESLALIPPETLVSLSGVTENRAWYKTSYDGAQGWVASAYLVLSLDGRKYARNFLESRLPRFDNRGF